MFSYLYFKFWQTRGKLLNYWNRYQKVYNAINWFSDNVQSGIFVARHECLIKVNRNLSNRQLVTCIIRLQKMLWMLIWNDCPGVSWKKIEKNHFLGHKRLGIHIARAVSKQYCIQYWAQKYIFISFSYRQFYSNI